MSLLFSLTLTLLTLNGELCQTVQAESAAATTSITPTRLFHTDLAAFNVSDLQQLDLESIEVEEDDREDREQDAAGTIGKYPSCLCPLFKQVGTLRWQTCAAQRSILKIRLRC